MVQEDVQLSLIINKPHLCTQLAVWRPKYSSQYTDEYGEPVALVHKTKVDFASPVIIVTFPKADHLKGQRFAIKKADAQKHKIGSNGAAPMYEIPMSHFESYETAQEIRETVEMLFP